MNYAELRQDARSNLKGKWGTIVCAYLIMGLIIGAAESIFMFTDVLSIIGSLASLLLTGPLTYGFSRMVLKLSRKENVEVGDLFVGFNEYSRTMVAGIEIAARIVLWTLLFIIPGIIAAYSYSMTYYIMVDNPKLSSSEAIAKSKELMKGHKLELFVLELTFIGWSILAIIFTLGIGLLWVNAYMETAKAEFYKKLTGAYAASSPMQEEVDENKVVSAEEIKPFMGTGSATEVYNLKCPGCGARETHTEKQMDCPYCSSVMKEDK